MVNPHCEDCYGTGRVLLVQDRCSIAADCPACAAWAREQEANATAILVDGIVKGNEDLGRIVG